MNQVTLTKEFTAGEDLVVIHKSEYDRFLNWSKKYSWADKELEADNDINNGRVSPTYKDKKSLARALDNLKRWKDMKIFGRLDLAAVRD